MLEQEPLNPEKHKTSKKIILILSFEFIQFVLFFLYFFFSEGWHEKTARIIIISMMIIFPVLIFTSHKISNKIFNKSLMIASWFFLTQALIFSIFKPYVISTALYDLYSIQKVQVLNPSISQAYLFFIFILFLALPRLKFYNFKNLSIFFLPFLLWILIRLLFL
jgi:hypothetical protein